MTSEQSPTPSAAPTAPRAPADPGRDDASEHGRGLATERVGKRAAGSRVLRVGRMLRARCSRALEYFPWTPLGVLLGLGVYGAIEWMARAQLDLVWLVVGYAGLAMLLVSPLCVLGAALWFKFRPPHQASVDALTLETGTWTDTGYTLSSPWYLPLVQLRWEWLAPRAIEVDTRQKGALLSERVRAGDRGRFEYIERRLRISDSFGLSRLLLRRGQACSLDVLPRLGGLRYLPALHALASGDAMPHPMGVEDGDRLELRRYTAGDPARFIHWKLLARTGKLLVRTPERALTYARRTAAFSIAGEDDDASAAVARLAIERRLLGQDWMFGTDRDPGGSAQVGEALAILMRSTEGRPRAGEGLSAFVQRVERGGPVSVIVFAPSRPGPWIDHLAAVARRRKLRVVIGTDGLHGHAPLPRWRRWLTAADRQAGTPQPELEQVLRALGHAGADAIVLDRGSGRQLAGADRRALLGLSGEPAWGVQ